MDDNGGEWVQENDFWYYYDSNGDMVTGWIKSDGDWYYCYDNGTMACDTMVNEYYVNNDGQWTKDERSREIIDDNGDHFWYYIGPNGTAVTGWNKIGDNFHYYYYPYGSMARKDTIHGSYSDSDEFYVDDYGNIARGTGWIKDEYSGKWYYYLNGSMQTGWVKEDDGTWYFLKSDGSMATGWQYVDGFWYYLQSDGSMAATKWVNDGTGWYYLYSNGSMARGTTANGYHVYQENGKMVTGTGWKYVDNKYYYLNSDDAVVTGWLEDKNNWYYLYPENSKTYSQGEMAENTTIDGWKVDDSGKWENEDSSNSQGTSNVKSTDESSDDNNSEDNVGEKNRANAVAYAIKYGKDTSDHDGYHYFSAETGGGSDCTNFVSQCLREGGYSENEEWNYKGFTPSKDWDKLLGHYDLKDAARGVLGRSTTDATATWVKPDELYRYFTQEKYCSGVSYITNVSEIPDVIDDIKPGDIIAFNNLEEVPKGVINHVAMVTSIKDGKIYFSGHTNERSDDPLIDTLDGYYGYIYFVHVKYQ